MLHMKTIAHASAIFDAAKAAKLDALLPGWLDTLPGAAMGMGWVTPVAVTIVLCAGLDYLRPADQRSSLA